MEYNFEFFNQPINRYGTDSVKWDVMKRMHGDHLNAMWVADMDFASPDEVMQAIINRAQHPVYGYTEQSESAAAAMSAYMQRHHHITVNREETFLLPGVVSGLRLAIRTLTKPGDSVIIQPPIYPPFYDSIRDNEREAALCPLKMDESNNFTMDLNLVENALKSGARLMLLCNPHNPVGRCWTREELYELMSLLARYDATLVSDEIHEDFVYAPNVHTPAVSLTEETGCRVIAMTSLSKTFNLAGLMQAFGYTRDLHLLEQLKKEAEISGVEAGNLFALVATEAAYTHGDSWLNGLKQYLVQADCIFRNEIAEKLPKAKLSPLQATYLEWLDLRAYGFSSDELTERGYTAGVVCNPGSIFGKEGESFLRINIGCPHNRVKLAAEQIRKSILG